MIQTGLRIVENQAKISGKIKNNNYATTYKSTKGGFVGFFLQSTKNFDFLGLILKPIAVDQSNIRSLTPSLMEAIEYGYGYSVIYFHS